MAGGVKGTAIASVIDDVKRLVAEGRIASEALEAQLEATDLEILEQKTLPSLWYPLETYGRLTALLLEVEGGGNTDYLVERGRRAAERLRTTGLYAQLAVDRARWGERIAQMMIPLGPTLFRDTVWRVGAVAGGDSSFEIEVDVQASYPDLCRYQTQGFIEYAGSLASGQPIEVTSERVAPRRMVFRGRTRS
jgi:hypothetical protein